MIHDEKSLHRRLAAIRAAAPGRVSGFVADADELDARAREILTTADGALELAGREARHAEGALLRGDAAGAFRHLAEAERLLGLERHRRPAEAFRAAQRSKSIKPRPGGRHPFRDAVMDKARLLHARTPSASSESLAAGALDSLGVWSRNEMVGMQPEAFRLGRPLR